MLSTKGRVDGCNSINSREGGNCIENDAKSATGRSLNVADAQESTTVAGYLEAQLKGHGDDKFTFRLPLLPDIVDQKQAETSPFLISPTAATSVFLPPWSTVWNSQPPNTSHHTDDRYSDKLFNSTFAISTGDETTEPTPHSILVPELASFDQNDSNSYVGPQIENSFQPNSTPNKCQKYLAPSYSQPQLHPLNEYSSKKVATANWNVGPIYSLTESKLCADQKQQVALYQSAATIRPTYAAFSETSGISDNDNCRIVSESTSSPFYGSISWKSPSGADRIPPDPISSMPTLDWHPFCSLEQKWRPEKRSTYSDSEEVSSFVRDRSKLISGNLFAVDNPTLGERVKSLMQQPRDQLHTASSAASGVSACREYNHKWFQQQASTCDNLNWSSPYKQSIDSVHVGRGPRQAAAAGHFESAASGGGLWYGNGTARGDSRWVRPAADVTSVFCDNYVDDVISSYGNSIYKDDDDDVLFLASTACGSQSRMFTTASAATNAVIAEYDKTINALPIFETGSGGGYFGLTGAIDCKAQSYSSTLQLNPSTLPSGYNDQYFTSSGSASIEVAVTPIQSSFSSVSSVPPSIDAITNTITSLRNPAYHCTPVMPANSTASHEIQSSTWYNDKLVPTQYSAHNVADHTVDTITQTEVGKPPQFGVQTTLSSSAGVSLGGPFQSKPAPTGVVTATNGRRTVKRSVAERPDVNSNVSNKRMFPADNSAPHSSVLTNSDSAQLTAPRLLAADGGGGNAVFMMTSPQAPSSGLNSEAELLNGLLRGSANSGVKIKLCNLSLWKKFHAFTNEMIITKTGRRLFPILQIALEGLDPHRYYTVFVDIFEIGNVQWKYQSSQWFPNGKDQHADTKKSNRIYRHPDGYKTGAHWMSKSVVFNKLKLTNDSSSCTDKQAIQLKSMRRYLPRISIVEVVPSEAGVENPRVETRRVYSHVFDETEFVAVTAYQNTDITQLKIDYNPFAKGFRDDSNANTLNITQRASLVDVNRRL